MCTIVYLAVTGGLENALGTQNAILALAYPDLRNAVNKFSVIVTTTQTLAAGLQHDHSMLALITRNVNMLVLGSLQVVANVVNMRSSMLREWHSRPDRKIAIMYETDNSTIDIKSSAEDLIGSTANAVKHAVVLSKNLIASRISGQPCANNYTAFMAANLSKYGGDKRAAAAAYRKQLAH